MSRLTMGTLCSLFGTISWLLLSCTCLATTPPLPSDIDELQFQILSMLVKGDVSGDRGATDREGLAISIRADSDAVLRKIARLPHGDLVRIKRLQLSDRNQTDASARILQELPGVTQLEIQVVWKDSWCEHFESLRLTSLRMQGLQMNGECLLHIGKIHTLEYLIADGNSFAPGSLKPLSNLKRLKQLQLSGSPIEDDDLSVLENMEDLKILSIDSEQITDGAIEHIKKCRNLRSVALVGTSITSRGAKELQEHFPELLMSYGRSSAKANVVLPR